MLVFCDQMYLQWPDHQNNFDRWRCHSHLWQYNWPHSRWQSTMALPPPPSLSKASQCGNLLAEVACGSLHPPKTKYCVIAADLASGWNSTCQREKEAQTSYIFIWEMNSTRQVIKPGWICQELKVLPRIAGGELVMRIFFFLGNK